MSENAKSGLNNLLAMVLVSMLGFFGTAVTSFYDDKSEMQRSYKEDKIALEKRVSELEKALADSMKLRQAADMLNMDLQHQLQQSVTQLDIVQAYIDALPLPAWVKKRRDDGKFEMIMINTAYVKEYDISKFEYVGKTDHEIWPLAQADQYQKYDELVYNSKRRFCGKGEIVHNKRHDIINFCKFPLVIGSNDYGVGGVVTSTEKPQGK